MVSLFYISIALAILLLLAIVAFFVIIAVGIKTNISFDSERMCLTLSIVILKEILLVKLKIFKCNGEIYYQYNKKNIKKLQKQNYFNSEESNQGTNFDKQSQEEMASGDNVPKQNKFFKFIKIMPTIKPNELQINALVANDDSMKLGMTYGIGCMSLGIIQSLLDRYFSPQNRQIKIYPSNNSNALKINANLTIKLEIFKILFDILHTLFKIRSTKKEKNYAR